MKHIIEENSRNHVLWWDSNGIHCTKENCEINEEIGSSNPTNFSRGKN